MNYSTSHRHAIAMPMPAPTYARRYESSRLIPIAPGTRVEWQDRVGTVTHGNLPNEWVPTGSGTVSVEFDTCPRGATRYAELFTDELVILPALTV